MTSTKLNKIDILKPTRNELEEDVDDIFEWLQDEDNIRGCNVLFSKNYGDLNPEFKLLRSDFCTIVGTDKGNLLKERGLRTLCADKIPWKRSDELPITVLFAVDNFGVEHTVAFMLTDRHDSYIFEVFFTKLKRYLVAGDKDSHPEILLTPVSQGVSTAFKNVTKNKMTKIAFSPWQVDHVWRTQLKMIKQSDKRKEVYKTLKGLQMESDRTEFEELYSKFLDGIKDNPVCIHFVYLLTYFYVKKNPKIKVFLILNYKIQIIKKYMYTELFLNVG